MDVANPELYLKVSLGGKFDLDTSWAEQKSSKIVLWRQLHGRLATAQPSQAS